MLRRVSLALLIVVAVLMPLGLNVTMSGAATQRVNANGVVIVTKPTTITVTHTFDQGVRTESVTATLVPPPNQARSLPTEYCVPKTGIEVCGSIEWLKYVTTVLTRALERYYKATETVEHLSTGQVKGVVGCTFAVAIALGPESTAIAGPVGIEDIEWSVGCAVSGVLGFIHHL